MYLDSELISRFLLGTIAVFAMVAIGGAFANMFRSVNKRFCFTKTALILTLPPFCLSLVLDRSSLSTLYLYAMIVIVIGFSVDAARHLIAIWRHGESLPSPRNENTSASESSEKGMVWEKIE